MLVAVAVEEVVGVAVVVLLAVELPAAVVLKAAPVWAALMAEHCHWRARAREGSPGAGSQARIRAEWLS